MAKRYWKVKWSYGYAGTDNEEVVDAMDYMNVDEEGLEALTDDEVQQTLNDDYWQVAIEQVECYAQPADEDDIAYMND
jgi:hypothetical protein